jgi:isoprenylcysteine carboxyl methyltransferase (ICMT) family protein YpbQ
MSPGGTEGGGGKFALGFLLSAVSLYFFFDSVQVSTAESGWISGAMRGGGGGYGMWNTTSMGIVFLPFFIGVVALFYNGKMQWAWYVTWIGLAIIVIEILSRLRFLMAMKTSHLLIMMVTFAAGAGLMLRSYGEEKGNTDGK